MEKSSVINVVFAPDNNYIDYCCVAIDSMIKHYLGDYQVNIYILSMDLTPENRSKLSKIIRNTRLFSLFFVEIDNSSVIRKFEIKDHFTTAMYSRILIPDLLDNSISKVIYLDSDVLVRKNIEDLWNINIDSYALGAVSTIDFNNLASLGIEEQFDYFNSGVLVFNLNKWRMMNYSSRIISYLLENSHKLNLPDQDALNYILHNDWINISLEWNVRTTLYNNIDNIKYEDRNILIDPAIVHFTTYSKPWHYFNKHLFKNEYLSWLSKYNYRITIPDILQVYSKKRLIIFGAGSAGIQAKQLIEESEFQVSYFCDNDLNKINQNIEDILVISPKDLIEDREHYLIIIASTYEKEIRNQLLELGFIEHVHFYLLVDFMTIKYDKFNE